MKCFGDNTAAQLGINSTGSSFSALSPARLAHGVFWSAAGFDSSCAIVEGNGLKCWGQNIGTPQDVPGAGEAVYQVTVGNRHKCLLNENFGVQCWGANESGQLGTTLSVASADLPLNVESLSSGVVQVVAGYSHSCALKGSGAVYCWGRNSYGQLGDGSTEQRNVPVEITMLGTDVLALSLATDYSCALKAGGYVWCWGNNDKGQLGDGTLTSRANPSEVLLLQSGNIALTTGSGHACAMDSQERIQCWGEDRFGQLGAAATYGNNVAPVSIVDF
jgi:alpha-tubulin suppressor-like RCC1 family protein